MVYIKDSQQPSPWQPKVALGTRTHPLLFLLVEPLVNLLLALGLPDKLGRADQSGVLVQHVL